MISLAAFFAVNLWAAYATSYNSLLATRLVGGLFGGIIEALGPEMVVEMFDEQHLARAMVVYVGFLAGGSAIGPVFAGLIGTGTRQWQWFFKLIAICAGATLLSCIIMLPETTPSGGPNHHYSDALEAPGAQKENVEAIEHTQSSEAAVQSTISIWVRRSFRVRISEFQPEHNFFYLLAEPFMMLAAPAVLVTIIIFGLTIGWTVASSIVLANVFQEPPLLFDARQVGLINLSPLVGIIIGLPVGGMLADFLSIRSTKRNDGVHQCESRLPAALMGGLVSPAGALIIGYTLRNPAHWIGPTIGWGLLAFGLTASANPLLSYAADAYPSKAGNTGVLVNVIKNVLAFGVSFRSMNWYLEDGPVKQFGAMAGALWGAYLLVIPLYFFGRRIRNTRFELKLQGVTLTN